MVKTVEEIEQQIRSKPVKTLDQIEKELAQRKLFAAGLDKVLMDDRLQTFLSADVDQDTKYRLANSLYFSSTFREPLEKVFQNYDGIVRHLKLSERPKKLFERLQWESMSEKQKFAAFDKDKTFWEKAEDRITNTGMNVIKAVNGLAEAHADLSGLIQQKILGKPTIFNQNTREWTGYIREALKYDMTENPDKYLNPAGDGFWDTTKEYLTHPEYILFGVAEQTPLVMASLLTGGGAAMAAKAAGVALKGAKAARFIGGVQGFAVPLFGMRYSDLRNEGIIPEKAFAEAFLAAQCEALLEEWTLSFNIGLFKGPGSQAKRSISRYVSKWLLDKPWYVKGAVAGASMYGQGASEEALQAISDNFWAMCFRNVNTDLLQGVGQQAAVGGLLELSMGGMFATTGKLFNPGYVSIDEQLARLDVIRDIVNQTPLESTQRQEVNQYLDAVEKDIQEENWVVPPAEPAPTVPEITPTKPVEAIKPVPATGMNIDEKLGLPASNNAVGDTDPVKLTERYAIQEANGKWIVKDWDTQQEVSVHSTSKSALAESISLNKGEKEIETRRAPLMPSEKVTMTIRQVLNFVMKGQAKAARTAYMQAAKDIVSQSKDLARYANNMLKGLNISILSRKMLINHLAANRTAAEKTATIAIIQRLREDALKENAKTELKKILRYINRKVGRGLYERGIRPEYYERIKEITDTFAAKKITDAHRKRLVSFSQYLENIKSEGKSIYETAYVESRLPKALLDKVASLDLKNMDDMSLKELQDITDTLKLLVHLNNVKSDLIMDRRAKGVAEMLDAAMEEAENLKQRPLTEEKDFSERPHKEGWFAAIANYFVGNKNHDIETLAETISSKGTFGVIWNILAQRISEGRNDQAKFLNAWDDMQRAAFEKHGMTIEDLQEFSDGFFQTIKDKALREKFGLRTAKRYTVTIENKKVDMTMGELLSLYMHSVAVDYNLPQMIRGGVASRFKPYGHISYQELEKVASIVESNPKAMALISMAEEILLWSADNINALSIMLDGIQKAQENRYWHVERYSLGGVAGRQEFRISLLESMSYLQEREGSERPIIIRDFFDVLFGTQQAIGEYIGLAMPLRSIKNLLNYRPFRDTLINLKGYGEELKLIDVLIERLEQHPHPYSLTDRIVKTMMTGLIRAALISPGIMIGQYTSTIGYFSEADWKYVNALRFLPEKETTQRYKTNWPLYRRRIEGGISSIALYDAMQSDVLLRTYTDKKSYANYSMGGIHYFDFLAITEAGRITEAEMADKNLSGKSLEYWKHQAIDPTTLTKDSAEYWDAFVKRADFLVRRTQPMFNTENRSVLTSAEAVWEKSLYLFRSYVDQPLRILYRAINDYKADRITPQSLAKSLAAIEASLIFYEILRFAVDKIMYRDDDDEVDLFIRIMISPVKIINLIGYQASSLLKSILTSVMKEEAFKYAAPELMPLPLELVNAAIKSGNLIAKGLMYQGTNERMQSGPDRNKLKSEVYMQRGTLELIKLGLRCYGVPTRTIEKIIVGEETEPKKMTIKEE